MRRPRPLLATAAFAVLVLAINGCVSLAPYEEVTAALPPGDLLTVDGQTVHAVDRGPRGGQRGGGLSPWLRRLCLVLARGDRSPRSRFPDRGDRPTVRRSFFAALPTH